MGTNTNPLAALDRRAQAMSGDDASSFLAEMPDRYSHVVRDRATRDPSRLALRSGSDRLSYGDLWSATGEAIRHLSLLGVRAGDRIALVAENGLQIVPLLLAVSELDAWAVPLNARMSAREVETIRQFSDCRRTLYCIGDSAAAVGHAAVDRIDRELFMFGKVAVSSLNEETVREPVYPDKARQAAVLVFTSGTTGEPKGVMLSHQALIYMGANMAKLRSITVDDTFYNSSPISHAIGLGTVLMTAFWAGASAELVGRFSPQHFIEALKEERITGVTAVPTLFARIVDYAEEKGITLRSRRMRIIATAGAPLDLALKARIEEAFGLKMGNSYGMTECNPVARSAAGVETNEVGTLQPGNEIRIVREDGRDAQAKESGEIWARGPTRMLGYYRNGDATSSVLREGGWLLTGDLGRMDEQGRLYIVGRSKDLIIRSGFNVYPAEVESVLSLFPGVALAAVVGREIPENEEVVAFVQPLAGCVLDVEAVSGWANQQLAPYKRPSEIIVMPELPIGPTGKIFKMRLKEIARGGLSRT
ncbi:MAG TPA: class I adenylate-forming enzyme family protein [Steroidobacteraceae bacterium]